MNLWHRWMNKSLTLYFRIPKLGTFSTHVPGRFKWTPPAALKDSKSCEKSGLSVSRVLQAPSWSAGPPAWWFCCWTASTVALATSWSWSAGCCCWRCWTPSWTPASTPTRMRRCGPPSRTCCAASGAARGGSGPWGPTSGRKARARTRSTVSSSPRRQKRRKRTTSRAEDGTGAVLQIRWPPPARAVLEERLIPGSREADVSAGLISC